MIPAIDVTKLPGAAQKILDPRARRSCGPRQPRPWFPASGRPICWWSSRFSPRGPIPAAEIARQTLAKLPGPVLNGALSADLEPFVLHKLGPRLRRQRRGDGAHCSRMPRIALETVADAAITLFASASPSSSRRTRSACWRTRRSSSGST